MRLINKGQICRLIAVFLLIISLVSAEGSRIVAIRDIVYGAENMPFSGRLDIRIQGDQNSLMSFFVEDGLLSIRLSSPGKYDASFTPNRGQSWQELWDVSELKPNVSMKEIRVKPEIPEAPLTTGPKDITLPIPLSDVSGLVSELSSINQRIASDSNAVAQIASSLLGGGSLLSGVSDDLSTQVTGTTRTFNLAGTPAPLTFRLFRNGLRLKTQSDYTLIGNQASLISAPALGDELLAMYQTSANSAFRRGITLPIPITAVTGLPQALSIINSSLTSLTSTISSLESGSLLGQSVSIGETPLGGVNGSNFTFTLMKTPTPGSLIVYRNGLRQQVSVDYSINQSSIHFLPSSVPQSGDLLLADYIVQ